MVDVCSTNLSKSRLKNNPKIGVALDTLAQLRKGSNNVEGVNSPKPLQTLEKRAKSKYITSQLDNGLRKLENSPLNKAYWNTYYCASSITQVDNKFTSKYCKNRWCMVCNRIRTAQLIKGYLEPLNKLQNPYFVTLTRPTIVADNLGETIDENIRTFKRIQDRLRKQGRLLNGIRKLEVTTRPHGRYHPHFHLIIEGKENAELLVNEWLKENTNADRKAQDITQANENSIIELMKYFTKVFSSKKTNDGGIVYDSVDPRKLDVIFQAMQGRRVYQPFGKIRKVSEDIKELRAETIEGVTPKVANYVWDRNHNNWFDLDSGEALTNYVPTEDDVKRAKSIMNIPYICLTN